VRVLFDPPPRVTSFVADCLSNKLTLTFSEPLDPADVEEAANYLIASGAGNPGVTSAVVGPGPNIVCLFTTGLPAGTNYLGIYNLSDRCGNRVPEGPYPFVCGTNAGPNPRILTPVLAQDKISFSMQTEAGVTCHVEYTDSLMPPNWRVLQSMVGDGSVVSVTDSLTNATQRFYRVRVD
jgi:hypothetical protein